MDLTKWLNKIGLESPEWIDIINTAVDVVLIFLGAWIAYLVVKKVLAVVVMRIARRTPYKWDDMLFTRKFFSRLGLLFAAIAVRTSMGAIDWEHIHILSTLVSVWITVASVLFVSSLLEGITRVFENFASTKDRPFRVFKQVIMIFIWCAAMMVIISIFTGKSVVVLLGGLTAFAAVLMLIFQDSILGFVAGIQLSANNMVRVGDWIVMPARGVDGDVIEINLTTVKVQNWDKTITTIPTHKLVSESFTNWRGMEESKGRRIKRSVNIDIASIHHLTSEDMERMRASELLREYIERKRDEIMRHNEVHDNPLDARRLTNIGTFREYLEEWIANHSDINKDMTHMVRQLQPGPTGMPLEIYCFSAKQEWIAYENVQSDIFDHIYAVMPIFGLRAFQYTGVVPVEQQVS